MLMSKNVNKDVSKDSPITNSAFIPKEQYLNGVKSYGKF